jgi:hypothetical protein
VTRVINVKQTYKNYVGVDATMANLMRPGMYGAYHHISVLGRENAPATTLVDVVGSLCENNDKFAIDRLLPDVAVGDTLVIHDAGAHGHAMGFQYNGRLRCAEFLFDDRGGVRRIRRAETLDDYFATVDFPSTPDKHQELTVNVQSASTSAPAQTPRFPFANQQSNASRLIQEAPSRPSLRMLETITRSCPILHDDPEVFISLAPNRESIWFPPS